MDTLLNLHGSCKKIITLYVIIVGDFFVRPLFVWVNVQVVSLDDHESVCVEFLLFSYHHVHRRLFPEGIGRDAGQEMTSDKLIHTGLVTWMVFK